MKISFYGAAQDVTGSNFLVETEQSERFLVDCGMFQGGKSQERLNTHPFPYDPATLDFVILTHAHIDHSGRLPKLVKDGFRGPIYTTGATRDLLEIMLADSAHIQEQDARWENRQRKRRGKGQVKPLYKQEDVELTLPLIKPYYYQEIFPPPPNLRIRFTDAGHILGSAIVEVWSTQDGESNKLVFSGDLGMRGHALISDPSEVQSADTLIMESTYGDTVHPDYEDSLQDLVDVISRVTARGGTVVIPSFAVGRTQELLYELNKYYEYRDVPTSDRIPIYIDSPLATQATAVFMRNTDVLGAEAQRLVRHGDNIFRFPNLHFTETVDESKALNNDSRPKVIISASGMATGGRVRHHLKHTLFDPRNAVIFVGYQAAGTLGRLLLDGTKRVKIMGSWIQVEAEMIDMKGFSAHADRPTLLDWVNAFHHKPSEIILVHGERDAMEPLAESLETLYNIKVSMPQLGDTLEVTPGRTSQTVDHKILVPNQRLNALEASLEDLQESFALWEGRDIDLEARNYSKEQLDELQRTLHRLHDYLMDLNMLTGD